MSVDDLVDILEGWRAPAIAAQAFETRTVPETYRSKPVACDEGGSADHPVGADPPRSVNEVELLLAGTEKRQSADGNCRTRSQPLRDATMARAGSRAVLREAESAIVALRRSSSRCAAGTRIRRAHLVPVGVDV